MANDILNIHCPSCGAPAEYDIVEQSYLCGHCGGRVKIEEALSQKAKYLETQRKRIKASAGSYPLRSSTCTGCGASVVFAESDAVTSCAFCGRSLVRQEYNYDGNIPESIIPFAVTKEEAEKRLLDWCDANPKKPEAAELRKCTSLLQGCYLPYEMARGPVSGYVYHPKATQNFEFDGFVNEEFVNVSKGLDNLLLDATEPYDTSALVPFDFAYVAGQVVKIKDIEDDNAEKRLKNEISSNYKPGFEKITVPVYYRVIETESGSTAYGSNNKAGPFSIENTTGNEELSVTGTVINPLKDTVAVTVKKVWEDNKYGDLKKNMPVSITVQLQFRTGDGEEWQDVILGGEQILSEQAGWNFTYRGLRADLQYRVIETAILFEDGILEEAVLEQSTLLGWTGRSNHFKIVAVNGFYVDEEGNTIYGCVITNTSKDEPWNPETGDNSHIAAYIGMAAASVTALAVAGAVKRKKRDED